MTDRRQGEGLLPDYIAEALKAFGVPPVITPGMVHPLKASVAHDIREALTRAGEEIRGLEAWKADAEEKLIQAGALTATQADTIAELQAKLEKAREPMNLVFRILNQYAEDPHEMGERGRRGRIDPQTILANVYAILAPAQQALLAEISDGDGGES